MGCHAPHDSKTIIYSPLSISGAVLVSTGVVRLDKRAVAPDHDKTGIFLKLTDNNTVALAA